MEVVNKYLSQLQEQFNARIAATDIHGDFEDSWTDCYETKCHGRLENKYEKMFCKAQCYLAAANKAITRLNAARSKCDTATDPNRCVTSLKKAAESYEKKISNARKMQDNANSKIVDFRRQTGA